MLEGVRFFRSGLPTSHLGASLTVCATSTPSPKASRRSETCFALSATPLETSRRCPASSRITSAPVVRNTPDGRELAMMRWGMPSSQKALLEATQRRAQKLEAKGKAVDFKEMLRMEPDKGTTNIRNVKSQHWRRWLNPESRCLVPFTSFSEFSAGAGGDIWFAFDEERPLASFAGDLDRLDVRAEGEGGRGQLRALRVSDHGTERGSSALSIPRRCRSS